MEAEDVLKRHDGTPVLDFLAIEFASGDCWLGMPMVEQFRSLVLGCQIGNLVVSVHQWSQMSMDNLII